MNLPSAGLCQKDARTPKQNQASEARERGPSEAVLRRLSHLALWRQGCAFSSAYFKLACWVAQSSFPALLRRKGLGALWSLRFTNGCVGLTRAWGGVQNLF